MKMLASLKIKLKSKTNKNLKANYLFNLLFQLFNVLIPILTTPYISKVLGAESYGQYSYISSYVSYFALVAAIGFFKYATRIIASHRGDKEQQSKDFWELMIAKWITTFACTAIYVVLAGFNVYGEKYSLLVWIRIISVINVGFHVSFFFMGEEEFHKIFIVSAINKIIGVVLIFLLVKSPQDIWIYALIIELELILSNVFLFPFLIKKIKFIPLKDLKISRHFKPSLVLFLPTVATSLYPIIDKTLIGLIVKDDASVGIYNKAQQLIDAISYFILAVGTVISPRNSYLFATGHKEKAMKNIDNSFNFVWLLSLPLMFGVLAVSSHLCQWYLPNDSFLASFGGVPFYMNILSPMILLSGFADILGLQFMIPNKQDKKYMISTIIAFVANVIITICMTFLFNHLIPGHGTIGAVVGTILSQLLLCTLLFVFTRKDISFIRVLKISWRYVISALVMFFICKGLAKAMPSNVLNTFVIVMVGAAIYFGVLILLRDSFLFSLVTSLFNKTTLYFSKINKNIKFESIAKYFVLFTFFITALSYSPSFINYGINKIVFVFWIICFLLCLPIGYKKIKSFFPILLLFIIPFWVFILFSCVITGINYVSVEFTKVIIFSNLILFFGYLSSDIIDKNFLSRIALVFILANAIVSLDIFLRYFRSFSFSTIKYAYAAKNAVSTNILLSIWMAFFIKQKNKIISFGFYVLSVFMFLLLLMLKSRAALLVIPIIVLCEIFNNKNNKILRISLFSLSAVLLFAILIIPSLKTLVVDNILLANHGEEGADAITSGRISLVSIAFNVFKLSVFFGIGDYYVDFAPMQWLISYGVIGTILLFGIISVLFLPFLRKEKKEFQITHFYLILFIIFIINIIFEAYAPFGPGIRMFLLWFFAGVVLQKEHFTEKTLLKNDATCVLSIASDFIEVEI